MIVTGIILYVVFFVLMIAFMYGAGNYKKR
jgi:hypothetical protein